MAVAAVAASLALLVAVLPDATRPAVAGTSLLTVYGFVSDTNGIPIEGASVNITIVETGAFRVTTTDPDGLYANSEDEFSMTEYYVGNTIRVVAKYSSWEQTNTTVIDVTMDENGLAQVDVRFSFAIPEFGGPLGTALVIVSATVVFALSSRGAKAKKT